MRPHRVRWKFTGSAAAFACVLIAILYAASSQQNSAAYVLLFAIGSIALVSLPHSVANIRGLTGRTEAIKPSFAGQEVSVPVEIANRSVTRRGIRLKINEAAGYYEALGEIPAGKSVRGTLRFSAPVRGEHQVESICLETSYPIGLMKITKTIPLSQRYIVYPKPAGDPKLPATGRSAAPDSPSRESGEGDDFAGVRAYIPGESQRHIDWKAVARGRELMTKQFTADFETGDFYLDYGAVRCRHLEDRLSQLALWIIEAERRNLSYGLRLPGTEIRPSLGESHFHQCLRTLALFK